VLRLATRGSALALWQASWVANELSRLNVGLDVELVVVSTEGDRRRDVPLAEIGGKGVFVKEIQAAVLDGRADLAVHSAKDLPALTPEELVIAAIPIRADPRDALVGRALAEIPTGGRVATGSKRREIQLRELRPDLEIVGIRGNIGTRLDAVDRHDAVVIAAAALHRLGDEDRIVQYLSTVEMIPQVGQGALGIECRADDIDTIDRVHHLDDDPTRRCVLAERAFLQELGGDCDLPAGAFAEIALGNNTGDGPGDGPIEIRGLLAGADGRVHRSSQRNVNGPDAGAALARYLRTRAEA